MGIIQQVLRPLMSGKEAEVYLVLSQGEERVAKVYKEAQNRSFRQRAEYTEGRAVRNSRDQRAMAKRTKYGRSQDEAAWRSTEVDMIYRLRNAGVRVPVPHHFIDGVLIMELVKDADGNPAPRLGEIALGRDEAIAVFDRLIAETVRMLSAGVVHGDLSEFNVLMASDGPVVIDFPQSVDASRNQNARKLLLRDVDNLHRFVSRYVPGWQARPLAHEMWELYARNQLFADTRLKGHYRASAHRANTDAVMGLIADANRDERRRREAQGLDVRGTTLPSATPTDDAVAAATTHGFRPRRVEVVIAPPSPRGAARSRPRVEEPPFDASRQGGGARTNAWARPANQAQRTQPQPNAMRAQPLQNAMRTQPQQNAMRAHLQSSASQPRHEGPRHPPEANPPRGVSNANTPHARSQPQVPRVPTNHEVARAPALNTNGAATLDGATNAPVRSRRRRRRRRGPGSPTGGAS
jgi:RIO kinase 1